MRASLIYSVVLVLTGFAPIARAQMTIEGAGATFPGPLYSKWFEAYRKIDSSVRFNYQAVGSGGGQKQITAQTVDFGASDAPMSHEALAQAPGKLLHIPTAAGAVVITYNLHGIDDLKLDGAAIAGIFLGRITQWDAPEIAAQNPGVKLPDEEISVVHRTDSSGTNYIFTDYLSAVSPDWKLKVGRYASVRWLAGLGSNGSEGVTREIRQTPGSIGYVELSYALRNQMPIALIKNAEGAYIKASLDSITAALSTATIPEDLRLSIVNAPGANSYPIAGVTWLLVYQKPKDPARARKLVEFLKWAETEGEKMAGSMDYAPLPENVRQRVLDQIDSIAP
jgi:phosphate transport system substrate-binding protein